MAIALCLVSASGASSPQALLVAALFTILATGVALWRSRFALAAMLVLVVITVAALHVWHTAQRLSPARDFPAIGLGTEARVENRPT